MINRATHSKAVVVLVHGMQEYGDRYRDFCDYLKTNDYSSIRYDLLGHGQKISPRARGYFGIHGWENLLDQLHQYVQQAHDQFANQKVILFGHSMGTIIIRSYLQHYHDFDGMIMSGVPFYNPMWRAGKLISKAIIAVKGPRRTSSLLTKLTTGGYNKKIKHPLTDFDWLCHNQADVRAYIKDRACGFPFTNQGYSDLYDGMKELGKLKHFRSQRPVPVLFVNGRDDPCSGTNSQIATSLDALRRAGFHDLTSKVYQGMRHEILFEKKGAIVEADIVKWLDQRFA